jgi:ribosomal protein L37AE/L43A
MELIATVSTAYSAAKGIMDIGKGLLSAKIDAEVKDKFRELLDRVGTFQEALFFLREELLKLQQDKVDLKAQIDEFEAQLDLRSKVQYIKPSYWVADGDKKDGPFCQRCWDVNQKLVRLQGGNNDVWYCYECKVNFTGEGYKAPKISQPHSGGKHSWMGV